MERLRAAMPRFESREEAVEWLDLRGRLGRLFAFAVAAAGIFVMACALMSE